MACMAMGNGCVYLTHSQELLFLKGLADNQAEMEAYAKRQEQGFARLSQDLRAGRLQKGMTKGEAVAVYGEPIMCKEQRDGEEIKETCLYREPRQPFATEWVHLDYDAGNRLVRWQLSPEP